MKNLKFLLEKELERYERVLFLAEKNFENVEGHLEISNSKNTPKLYYVTYKDGKRIRKYLNKENNNFAKKLVNKYYSTKIIRLANKRIKQIKEIIKDYSPSEIDNVYNSLHKIRKSLLVPYEKTYTQLINDFSRYTPSQYYSEFLKYQTKKGEYVRSKSEKILADLFFDNNIPYFYERPIQILDITLRPDFTFINPYTKKEVFLEHLGKTNSLEYVQRSLEKIQLYRKNGYYLDEQLILSFETINGILDTEFIINTVKRCLS